MTAKFRNTV